MEAFDWKTPLWKMQITDQQYANLKKTLKFAFVTNDIQRINSLAKESALFCAEWWRREHIEGHPSRMQVLKSLGLDVTYKKNFFDLAYQGLEQLKINPVRLTNEHKFRTLLMQGGLPIAKIKHSGDAINGYQLFLAGIIRYTKNKDVNWKDHSFIRGLNSFNYLPKTFQDQTIYEQSLQIARAIIEDNDEFLPYDVTEEYWRDFTNALKKSARSLCYKVPFIVNWKATINNNHIQLFFSLYCGQEISEAFIDDNHLEGCYSFKIYINNKFAAIYVLSSEGVFIKRDDRNIIEKWQGEPIVNIHLKTEDNRIIELTVPNCTLPDFENPVLMVQPDDENQMWEIKNSTNGNFKNAVVFQDPWIIQNNGNESIKNFELGSLILHWFDFSETIELKNIITGEVCIFDQNESAYKHEFINWKTDWIQQSRHKVLISEPIIRVYDENLEKIASNKFSVFFREYRDSNWRKIGENALPVGLLEFKIVYPDGKFGKEKFFFTGPIRLDYNHTSEQQGIIQWSWKSGKIYTISNQKGLKTKEIGEHIWEMERDNDDGGYYPEKVGFVLDPITASPGLEIFVATPFKGIIIIDENGGEIPTNKIISSNALYAFRYMIMGYEKIKTKIFHLENPKVVIKGELGEGINSLSRFEDDIRKLFDLQGSETFSEDSKVRIVIGIGSNCKTIEVRDFNLYTKHAGSFDGIQVINNRNDMQLVDYNGKIQAVSVNCSSEEIQVVELEKTEEGFVFNPENKLEQFIVFTDKYNNNGSADLVVPRYFDFDFQADQSNVENPSGLSPQEINILSIKNTLENTTAMDDEWKKVYKYFLIAINHHIPFKTFNHLRAVARTPDLLAKLFISLGQSAELAEALPKEKMINALVSFEQEMAIGWHWLNSDEHWKNAIDWYLKELPDFLIPEIQLMSYTQIKELLDYSLSNQHPGLINRLLSEDCATSTMPPSNAEVNEIRAKLGANQNYPETLLFVPEEWTCLFPKALNNELPLFIRSFLFSPVKAALAFMGKDLSIWNDENIVTRRVINFYRQLKPKEYLSLFENMVCQIKNKSI